MDPYNTPDMQQAYKNYEQSANTAIEYNSAASMLPQKLKDAINEKLDYNKDLIEQKNKLASEYFQAPSEARAKYADPTSANYVFNPFQAEQLVSTTRQQAWQPYQTASDVLTARTGSLADIINAASQAFLGEAGVMKDRAGLARQKWEDLFSVAKQKESDKGSGSGGFDFTPTPTTPTEPTLPTEPIPTLDMSTADPNVNWRSEGGQWEWNWDYMTWVPAGAEVID